MDWTELVSQNNAASSPQTQANIDYLKSQTAGQDLTNQGTALSLDFRRQLAAGMAAGTGGGAPGQPQVSGQPPGADSDFSLNEQSARQHLFQKYSPIPDVWTSEEQNMRTQAAMSGIPGAVDAVKAQHDARIQGQNALRNKGAQQEYNGLYGVVTAPEGQALDALSLVDPVAAARLKDAGLDDAQVRQHAERLAGLTHSVGQLPIEYRSDGVPVDKTSQQEVLGYDQAVGLSAANRADLVKAAQSVVDVPNSDGSTSKVPQWKADGASSLEAWVSHAGSIATTRGASPAQVTAAGVVPAPASNRPSQIAAPAANQPPAKAQSVAAAAPADPALRTALADPDFKLTTVPVKAGTSATPGAIDQQKAQVAARTDLLKDAAETTNNASQAIAYAKAAQAIMQSKGAPSTGLPGVVKNALSQWTGGTLDESNYQEAAKYLGNLALQGAKTNYGSRMTGNEVLMQKDELSASVHMNPDAINNILSRNIRDAQYALDTASRTRPYLATQGDPQQFAQWNQKHFERDKIVNGESDKEATKAAAAVTKPMPAGAKLQAYAAAHFGGDAAKASQFLSGQGYK